MIESTSKRSSITSRELAQWLEGQKETSWWTVDGDNFLTERLNFPCPGREIADLLSTRKQDLFLYDLDQQTNAKTQPTQTPVLDQYLSKEDRFGNRVIQLAWEKSPDCIWLLIEDTDTPKQNLILDDDG